MWRLIDYGTRQNTNHHAHLSNNLFNFLGDSKRLTKLQKVDYFESLVRKFSKWSPEKRDYFAKIDYLVVD